MHVHGSLIPKHKVGLARFWSHEICDHNICLPDKSRRQKLPSRVLDISRRNKIRLVAGEGRKLPYACLSYKWGQAEKFLLTSENMALLERGVPTSVLPRTFAEAIRVAHELELPFLWIDALCIKQDSPNELAAQIGSMGDIFQGSALTLFAAAGDNPDSGLGTSDVPKHMERTKVYIEFIDGNQRSEGWFSIVGFEWDSNFQLTSLPLFKRGWVLQEEVFSRRALIFGDGELWWRCIYREGSERKPLCGLLEDEKSFDEFRSFRAWVLGMDEGLSQLDWLRRDQSRGILRDWYQIIESYSTRELTFKSDLLPGIAALAARVHKLVGYTYVAGHWAEDLQESLLWHAEDYHESDTGKSKHCRDRLD